MGCSSTADVVSEEQHSEPLSAASAFETTDLVWRNTSTGQNVFWGLLGTDIGSSGAYQTVTDQSWKLEATADFNNDGITDFAWRNYATGENAVWYLDEAGAITGTGHLTPLADGNWHMVAAADMNRDGHADLLWRNSATGENAIWYLDGTTVKRGVLVQTLADQSWKLRGAGDLDGDGRPELIWRNSATGQNAAWFMSGDDSATIARGEFLTPVADASWQLETVADIDHDGKADLLWRNLADGGTAVWFMNGSAIAESGFLTNVADASWRIVGARRQQAHGAEFDAQPGTAAHDRGIRKWLVNPGKRKGAKTTVLGSDGRTIQVSTQTAVSEMSGDPAHYNAITQRALLQELGAQDAKNARGKSWAATIPEYEQFWSAVVHDMPKSAPNPRGSAVGGPDGELKTCYDSSYLSGLAAFGAIAATLSCLSAATTTVGCGTAAFMTAGAVTPLCAGMAYVTVGACAGAYAALCGLNGALVSQACCHGETTNGSWPNSCLPGTTTTACTCSDKAQFATWHVESGGGILDDSVICKPGQYKQLLKVRTRRAGTPGASGVSCGTPEGKAGYRYAETIGYEEHNYDWWDAVPTITTGYSDRSGGAGPRCGSHPGLPPIVIEQSLSGTRTGKRETYPAVTWDTLDRESNSNGYNGDSAQRVDRTVVCEGWDDAGGPQSEYAKCVEGYRADAGGVLSPYLVAPVSCVGDPCGAVGWNE